MLITYLTSCIVKIFWKTRSSEIGVSEVCPSEFVSVKIVIENIWHLWIPSLALKCFETL